MDGHVDSHRQKQIGSLMDNQSIIRFHLGNSNEKVNFPNVWGFFFADFEYGQGSDRARPLKNIQSWWVWARSNKHDIPAPRYQNKPNIRAS